MTFMTSGIQSIVEWNLSLIGLAWNCKMHVRNVAARNMTIISHVSVLFVMLYNIGVLVVDDIVFG